MLIASIDVGVINLALVFALVDEKYTLQRILHAELVDTTVLQHVRVGADVCTLGHSKTMTDRLTHFVQERAPWFEQCDKVLIERQPPLGLTNVQELLFLLFRAKAELVSPNAMHKHFNINGFTYEGRKQRTVEIATPYLTLHAAYNALDRQHDIADAVCQLLFWLHTTCTSIFPPKRLVHRPCEEDSHAAAVQTFAVTMSKFKYQKKI